MDSLKEDVMLCVLNAPDARIKNQSRDEPDLSECDKKKLVGELLEEKPAIFLERFWTHLRPEHMMYFDRVAAADPNIAYQIQFYSKECNKRYAPYMKSTDEGTQSREDRNKAKKQALVTKHNRRYEAMLRLTKEGEYFEEESMKERDPFGWEEIVGQYLPEEEKHSTIDKSDLRLSSILLKHMDEQEQRIAVEVQRDYENMCIEEEEEDAENYDSAPSTASYNQLPTPLPNKSELRENFLEHMRNRFLRGDDSDYFDYSAVDNSADYDNLEIINQDAEDMYFETE